MRPAFRPDPKMPPSAVKSYRVFAPVGTHWKTITCDAAGCEFQADGWCTTVDEATPLGQSQAGHIRHAAGRRYIEAKDPAGLTVFTFPPGQQCFSEHKAFLDRPGIYVVADGDWRGNPRGTPPRVHSGPVDWVDDFATHQDQLATRLAQG